MNIKEIVFQIHLARYSITLLLLVVTKLSADNLRCKQLGPNQNRRSVGIGSTLFDTLIIFPERMQKVDMLSKKDKHEKLCQSGSTFDNV